MCQQGVLAAIERIQAEGLSGISGLAWAKVADGFGRRGFGRYNPELASLHCPICHEALPLIRRALISESFNLPDAAVYQRLVAARPAIALGHVTEKTTSSRRPTESVRGKWQSLLWDVYHVAFVDVEGEHLGALSVGKPWAKGAIPPTLQPIVADCGAALASARAEGGIPLQSSNTTRDALPAILAEPMARHGFVYAGKEAPVPMFWWQHAADLAYQNRSSGLSLAIEVKVDEDREHPINQPLADLLSHNAVLNLRIPARGAGLEHDAARHAKQAEKLLEATGRVAFLVIE